jgi:prepilin-type N-terminal cleavage/methylation domain-containing protein
VIRARRQRQLDRRSFGSDRGFTLSELLVVIVLFSIIGGIVGTVVRVGLKHQAQMQDRSSAFASARTVIQRVDRDIRAADPLDYFSPTTISMSENGGVTGSTAGTVTYVVSAVTSTTSQLAVYPCGLNSASVPICTGRVLISNLVQTGSTPVFSPSSTIGYAAPVGSAVSVDPSTCQVVNSTPTQYDPSCVGTISVHLLVQPSTINQPVNISDNGTELRNAS